MSIFDDDDNSDDYEVPPGFNLKDEPADAHTCQHGRRAWTGNECASCELGDLAIVMGRPVEPNEIEKAIGDKMGLDFSDPYDGSQKESCKRCMREVWIGPKQRAKVDELDGCIFMCPTCAVQSMNELGAGMESVVDLGGIHERGN